MEENARTRQEEGVSAHVQDQSWKGVARVAVVPHADLEGNDGSRVEEQEAAHKEHH
jgi:hypothetical protein